MTDTNASKPLASHRAAAVSPEQLESLLSAALGLPAGASPFPWQQRLLRRLLDGEIPRSLDIPTGLGKTATICIWLLARALGAELPRRLVYVVDRRAVVDQATREAERLRRWVESDAVIREGLGLGDDPLPVSTLRGQFVDNREWLADPARPAIVVGTVDMIGSRLLFGGYRASRRLRPFMAGLMGHDALFVLDEAHLVPPFERLMERVASRSRDLASQAAFGVEPPPPRLLSLSATGRSRGGAPFDLDDDDLAHPVVKKRLSARKRLSLVDLEKGQSLAEAAAEAAWAKSDEGRSPIRCVVFLHKREDAEKAKAHLEKLTGANKVKKGQEPPLEAELLVGGRRIHERVRATRRLEELGFLAGSETERARPHFLFATSAGEVGVDLDADHMVGDLVPWERLVQRLGRVNRRGDGSAEVLVLRVPSEESDRLAGVRQLLDRLPVVEGGVDVSPGALRDLQREARSSESLAKGIAHASTPEPHYPPLERPTLDAWAMTSLEEHPGRPAIAPWLRGWIEDRPQTSIAWRAHLPLIGGAVPAGAHLSRYFQAAPLHTSEALETETFRAAEWLKKRAKKLLSAADKLEKAKEEEKARALRGMCVGFLRRRDGGGWEALSLAPIDEQPKARLERDLEGADLIVSADFGGLSGDGLLDPGEDAPPPALDGEGWELDDMPIRVRSTADQDAVLDAHYRERERFPLEVSADGEVTRWLVVERRLGEYSTEEDRSAGSVQTLAEHAEWTAARARSIGERLGLHASAIRLLELAARLHDEGKRARRWQRAFHAPEGEAYAKTRGPVNVALLEGYRHELGSLPYAEADSEVAALSPEERDLVLHLIASHHGYARPTIRAAGCEDAPPSMIEARTREIALRYARLGARLGPWGLAWWEALLRSADQQASREIEAAQSSEVAR